MSICEITIYKMVFWYMLYYHENIGYDAWRQLKTLCHCQKDSTWWKRSCFITKVFFVIRYKWNNPIKTLYLHMSNVFISLLTMCIYRRAVRQNVSHVWLSMRIKPFLARNLLLHRFLRNRKANMCVMMYQQLYLADKSSS